MAVPPPIMITWIHVHSSTPQLLVSTWDQVQQMASGHILTSTSPNLKRQLPLTLVQGQVGGRESSLDLEPEDTPETERTTSTRCNGQGELSYRPCLLSTLSVWKINQSTMNFLYKATEQISAGIRVLLQMVFSDMIQCWKGHFIGKGYNFGLHNKV